MWLFIVFIICSVAANRETRILSTPNLKNYTDENIIVINDVIRSLRDLNYNPVGVLVHDDGGVLKNAMLYLTSILNNPTVGNDFWLMKFNASGVSTVLAKSSLTNANQFIDILKPDEDTWEHLGYDKGGSVFYSILKAVQILPRGSGILIFTNRKVEDEDVAKLAVNEAVKKQIKIYVVWDGFNINGEERILKDACLLTRGNFINTNTESEEIYLTDTKPKSIVAYLENIYGKRSIKIPIDNGVSGIHISLSGVNTARFISPNGYLINLLNMQDVRRFSRGSHAVKIGNTYEIQINTAQGVATPVIGSWRLETDAFAQNYNLTVSIQNDLVLSTQIKQVHKRPVIRLDLQGDFTKIENISLVNKNGLPIPNKFIYNSKDNIELEEEIETIKEKEIDIKLENLPNETFYIQVNGKDKHGNDFTRMNYFNPDSTFYNLRSTTIEAGLGSELMISSGQNANLYFEVTNNRDRVVYVYFICRDDKTLLRWMQPMGAWLNPRQTLVVTVAIYAQPRAGTTYKDLITLSAIAGGLERTEKSVIVNVGSYDKIYDATAPYIWYQFSSDCLNVLLRQCQEGSWALEVTAQDKDSGLLRLTSNPLGLNFPNGWTSGTKEEVTGYIRGSCCQPTIQIMAVDLFNNRRSYIADAYKPPLSVGAIVGIVLGVLLIIAIIIIIICLCKKGKCKCGKQSASVDLPTTSYRGPINSASTRRY